MLKVLLSAYACEPHKGSEPGVGWNWAKQIARFAEVWVITRANNKEVIEEELKENPEPNMHFVYVDLPKWMRFWKKGEMSIRVYYLLWQIFAYFEARQLHKLLKFDLAHHITFLVDWLPACVGFLPIPFVWGPIGGTSSFLPYKFFKGFKLKQKVYEVLRFAYLHFFTRVDPLLLMCKKKASAILVSTKATLDEYAPKYSRKIYLMSAIGIDENEINTDLNKAKNQLFTLFTAGRHVHWKGHSLALKAFTLFTKNMPNSVFYIAGEGPETYKLQELSLQLSISDKVHFLGFIKSRREYLNQLTKGDVFVLPTLRDAPLVSFLEAMLLGIPIICIDSGGQTELVSHECGIKVKPISPDQTIRDLAEALLKLANDSELRRKMGDAGRRRVMEHYTWDKKGNFIKKVYEEILGIRL